MKINSSQIECPIVYIIKNKIHILAIGQSIKKVFPINFKERLKGLCKLFLFEIKIYEEIPKEFKTITEENIRDCLKHQLPPRFF